MGIELHEESQDKYNTNLRAISDKKEIFSAGIQTFQDGEPPQFIFQWTIGGTLAVCLNSASDLFSRLEREYSAPRKLTAPRQYPFLSLTDEPFRGYLEIGIGIHVPIPFFLKELTEPHNDSTFSTIIRTKATSVSWVRLTTAYFSACFDGGNIHINKQRRAAIVGLENLADEILPIHTQIAPVAIPGPEQRGVQVKLNEFWSNLPKLNRI